MIFRRIFIIFMLGLISHLLLASSACKRGDSRNVGSNFSDQSQPGEKFSSGETAPPFEFPSLAGPVRSLASFSGKIVVLNFWATWCVPCVAEMPALERLYKTYKDRGLEVVAINVDPPDNRETVKKFVADNALTFTVLLDSDFSLPTTYGLTGFPESFFISGSGQFLNFRDIAKGKPTIRVVGDRPWDSPAYISAVGELFEKK